MTKNCLICGVGGQGVVLASKLIAFAAMRKGLAVRTTDTIGMAQRGGSVMSHVRMSDGGIHSPLVPHGTADLVLGFEPAETVRALPWLRPGGVLVVTRQAVQPVTAALSGGSYDSEGMLAYLRARVPHLYVVDGEALCRSAGSPKVLNVALLGVAAQSGALDISLSEMRETVRENVPSKYLDLNLRALQLGAETTEMGK
jgi:indolepyruvate ferredoxin oxidoreductase beta subunit